MSRVEDIKAEIAELEAELAGIEGDKISPLAPAGGFPQMPVIDGVRFASAAAGVKYQGRDDVMLAEICAGASLAGVFTRSSTRSANVLDCQDKLARLGQSNDGFAIIVNSGNSNAFTGRAGDASVARISERVAEALSVPADHVFTASTGVIGERLPDDRITDAVGDLVASLSDDAIEAAAKAIMTTDTYPKGASAEIVINGEPVRIAGFAKGSGMIAPDMATMLVYIFTDAKIDQSDLQALVSELNVSTFNSITVDSDTSTSDTLLVAATGKSAVVDAGLDAFRTALGDVMRELAHLVVRDGEGATKFIEIEVTGGATNDSAATIARAIANSPLVKTAIAGEDPNWGRVVMAIGKCGEPANRDAISIRFGNILVADQGWVASDYHEDDGAAYMKNAELKISVDLGLASGSARVWTCDLTHQYITINADYRS